METNLGSNPQQRILKDYMQQEVVKDQLYQHRYGGVYQALGTLTNTVDGKQYVYYVHLYPFDQQVWCRPIEEWTEDRFTPITPVQFWEIRSSMYRCDYRDLVTTNKVTYKAGVV